MPSLPKDYNLSGLSAIVPGYSGGPVSDLHGVPCYSLRNLNYYKK